MLRGTVKGRETESVLASLLLLHQALERLPWATTQPVHRRGAGPSKAYLLGMGVIESCPKLPSEKLIWTSLALQMQTPASLALDPGLISLLLTVTEPALCMTSRLCSRQGKWCMQTEWNVCVLCTTRISPHNCCQGKTKIAWDYCFNAVLTRRSSNEFATKHWTIKNWEPWTALVLPACLPRSRIVPGTPSHLTTGGTDNSSARIRASFTPCFVFRALA